MKVATAKKTKAYEFPVVIEKDIDGSYFARVPSLQGCFTSGETLSEALENIKEVIGLILEDLKAGHHPIPRRRPVSVLSVEVCA